MIIINSKVGLLANQLFRFSHFIANSVEYQYKLINPFFEDYCKYFDATSNNNFNPERISIRFSRFKFFNNVFRKLIVVYKFILPRIARHNTFLEFHSNEDFDKKDISFDLNQKDFQKDIKKKLIFVEGWLYRDDDNFLKYADLIRTIFTPKKEYLDQVEAVVRSCRIQGEVVVGVHLRRGDYKEFCEGKWYYSDQLYFSKMLSLSKLFGAKNQKCSFLLCSNEPVDTTGFGDLCIVTEKRHMLVDLYSLSMCDYIIAPPSTFSMWASFYGKVPLFIMYSPERPIELSDFEIIKS